MPVILDERTGTQRLEDVSEIPKVWDWEVRSIFEVRKDQTGKSAEVIDYPDQRKGVRIEGLDGLPPYVERVWRKHDTWSGWADSNTRAACDALEL